VTRYDWQDKPCPWAVANPDKAQGSNHCTSWRQCAPKDCNRKRYAAQQAAKERSAYRKFPGSPYQQDCDARLAALRAAGTKAYFEDVHPRGHCRWCGGGIRNPKNPSALHLHRTWHAAKMAGEPDCLTQYFLHTRSDSQLWHLRDRDGPMCAQCGERHGSDVDHRLALGLVVLVTPLIDRWTWWGPGNLQLLCHPCHVAKTRADVVAMKRARLLLAGVAQPALL
jgi:hypothetical protein